MELYHFIHRIVFHWNIWSDLYLHCLIFWPSSLFWLLTGHFHLMYKLYLSYWHCIIVIATLRIFSLRIMNGYQVNHHLEPGNTKRSFCPGLGTLRNEHLELCIRKSNLAVLRTDEKSYTRTKHPSSASRFLMVI